MKEKLRALGIGHGVLLGLALTSPMIAPTILPWAIEALFLVTAFQLRLADRRWDIRAGIRGWVSHIRMAPARLLSWAGIATLAATSLADQSRIAFSILAAMLAGELLIYPLAANLLGRLPRPALLGVLALLLMGCALAEPGHPARLVMAFALGISGCVFWLRGPDGEAGSLMMALAGAAGAATCILLLPGVAPLCWPLAFLFGILSLAHLSVMRRHPTHWRLPTGSRRSCVTLGRQGTKAAKRGFAP